jgi:hypothetical protein
VDGEQFHLEVASATVWSGRRAVAVVESAGCCSSETERRRLEGGADFTKSGMGDRRGVVPKVVIPTQVTRRSVAELLKETLHSERPVGTRCGERGYCLRRPVIMP